MDSNPERRSAENQFVLLRQEEYLALLREILTSRDQIERKQNQLEINNVTGLANGEGLKSYWARLQSDLARRNIDPAKVSTSFVIGDLEGFKKYNDDFSWQTGNEVLIAVGAAVKESLRSWDLAVNPFGDSFIALVMGGKRAAAVVQRRIEERVRGLVVTGSDPNKGVSFEIHPRINLGYKVLTAADSLDNLLTEVNKKFFEEARGLPKT